MSPRYEQRKPWPDEWANTYFAILELADDCEIMLDDIYRRGLNGSRNYEIIRVGLQESALIVGRIMAHCQLYLRSPRERGPYWPRWALEDILMLSTALMDEISGAKDERMKRAPNWKLIEVYVEESVALIREIREQMLKGPGPEGGALPGDEVLGLVRAFLGEDDDDESPRVAGGSGVF